jgi:hypothetical protein
MLSSGSISKSLPSQQAFSKSSAGEWAPGLLLYLSWLANSRLEKLVPLKSRISWLVVSGFMMFALYCTAKLQYHKAGIKLNFALMFARFAVFATNG